MELVKAIQRGYGKGINFSGEKHSPLLLTSDCNEFKKKMRNIKLNRKWLKWDIIILENITNIRFLC